MKRISNNQQNIQKNKLKIIQIKIDNKMENKFIIK